ncbi:TolC family protein [Phenylobacterium sp. 20VBR1]|uniref:TolC family protein n=1 Tax=Phenylobacterium glaciei TaxID=2803784 RepID=A0A941D386_9CAUL|nr:TolC family protein [Phenylobacterium glaciei]MBR7620008.1 TolC family protein [Phenylobacterium glaciei]
MPKPFDARPWAPSRRLLMACAVLFATVSFDAVAAPLTLPEALTRAAAYDPSLPAGAARVQAAEAGVRQAGVRPNPILGADLENFAGSGDIGLADRSEATLYYEQTWERGGKREARVDVARAELALARGRAVVRALDLMAEVQSAWVEALAAQAQVAVAEERLAVARRLEGEVERRVRAARDPLFSGERARTATAQARIDRDQALAAAEQARRLLASYWGGEPGFELNTSALEAATAWTHGQFGETPDLRLLATERDLSQARIAVERARAVQDPRWRAGLRHFGQSNDVAVIIGGSIPLGRNDTNRGGIERAQAERTAADADLAAARTEREREIARIAARREATLAEVARSDAEVVPSAARAVTLVRDGFNRGGGAFTYLEVAEAQRAVIEARSRRIELLKRFHLDGVRLDRLTGRHAALLSSAETR